jgi:inosine/xanthosine triphosphatase
MTQTIIVASKNPVKIDATRIGFERMFPDQTYTFEGLSVPSGVSDQPMSNAETLQGAQNRVANAVAQHPDASYVVGIEGGIEVMDNQLAVFAWVVVQSAQTTGQAQTGVFYLPDEVAQLVLSGLELGDADDKVFGHSNSKQQNGSIGLLTDDALTRTSYYVNAVIMALIPFKKPQFTWRS